MKHKLIDTIENNGQYFTFECGQCRRYCKPEELVICDGMDLGCDGCIDDLEEWDDDEQEALKE